MVSVVVCLLLERVLMLGGSSVASMVFEKVYLVVQVGWEVHHARWQLPEDYC